VERLPAYAPELNPGEGLWQQLKGVERRNVCGVDIPHLRGELRDAVKRVRRKPRMRVLKTGKKPAENGRLNCKHKGGNSVPSHARSECRTRP
jgi:hypothetical protein